MASGPCSAMVARKRFAISSSASSQEMRWKAPNCAPLGRAGSPVPTLAVTTRPFGAALRMGYKTRSGEYTRSRYFATLAQRNPWVTGCSGSP